MLSPSAPPRFSQFVEYTIAEHGTYAIPQWSPDSRYLAFVDVSRSALMVYDTETKARWNVATNISSAHFAWTPNSGLVYLRYRPDLSGSPYPIFFDLYQTDLNGANNRIIAANLSSARDFAWFSDGQRIAILLTNPDERTFFNDVYILDVMTGTTNLLLRSQEVGLQYLTMIALSSDEKLILMYGVQEENGLSEAQIVIYSLETHTVLSRIIPSELIPSGSIVYPKPGIGDGTNLGWVGGQRWFLASVNTPGGECYNYALFFFDTHDLQNSFCISTVNGPFTQPAISPDLTKISYITVGAPGASYIMIGAMPSDILNRLQREDE